MNLSPWSVVADGHCGMENDTLLSGFGTVIDHHSTQNRAVGNCDQLFFLCADASHQQCLLNYLPHISSDPHEVSDLESAHVSENSSGDSVRYRGGGAE